MTTTPASLKLVKGNRSLELIGGPYTVGMDFRPPTVEEEIVLAGGTSANRYGGASRVGSRAKNRSWEFGLNLSGSSVAELASHARQVQLFLDLAGDESEPLYLEHRDDASVPFDPLWGQFGAARRYEIVHGKLELSALYGLPEMRTRYLPNCRVALEIRPYALGLRQRLGSAIGGVLEDWIGAEDGVSRGLIVPEATTNKMTNPVFGYSTWNNGCTATSLTAAENTDETFLLFGKSSAKLTDPSGAGQFTQSIDAGNTNAHVLSCYVKLPDGGAVSVTQCQLYYDTAETTEYQSVGDGWYRLTAAVTGIGAGTATGIEVKAGMTIYADGFQLEEKAYATPLAYGDLLGCAWTGTAHDSTSTRTAARVSVATVDSLDVGEGTIRVAMKMNVASEDLSGSPVVFDDGNLSLVYDTANTRFDLADGTNTASGAAFVWDLGDVVTVYCTYGPAGGLDLFVDGLASGAGVATYTPPTLGTALFIGTDTSAANHINATMLGFATFARAMSAAEAAADYANIAEVVDASGAAGRRLECIPWLWTKDGDDITDNCDDSTRDNWMVSGGIPGSVPALTRFDIRVTNAAVTFGWWLIKTLQDYGNFRLPTQGPQYYKEESGTASATDSGGEYRAVAGSGPATTTITPPDQSYFDKNVHFFVKLSSTGGSATLVPEWRSGTVKMATGDAVPINTDTSRRWYYGGALYLKTPAFVDDAPLNYALVLNISNFTGGLEIDFSMFIPGSVLRLSAFPFTGSNWDRLIVQHGRILLLDSAGSLLGEATSAGDTIDLDPGSFNLVWFKHGRHADATLITTTATFIGVDVTPRWALL